MRTNNYFFCEKNPHCIRHVKYFHVHWKWNHFHRIHIIIRSCMWLFFLHRRHTIVSMNMEVNNSVTSWFINVFNWGSAQSAHFSKWKQKTHRNMRKKRKQTAQRKLRTETTAKWATRSPFEANENAYTLIYKNGSYREIISEQQKNGAAAVFEELAHTHTHG